MVDESKEKSDSVLTEQRVTRTVIRRRASAPTPSTPIEETVVSEAAQSAQSEQVMAAPVIEEPVAPPPPPPVEVQPEPEQEVSIEEPPALEPEPVPQDAQPEASASPSTDSDADSRYRYKRIKVVTATVTAPVTPEFRMAPPSPTTARRGEQGAANPESLLASPRAAGLGRKEIIEIRDFHKPKGGRKKRLSPGKKGKKTEITTPKAIKRVVKIAQDAISVAELARRLNVKVGEVIQKLISMGTMATINQNIDMDTATLIGAEFGYEIENVSVAPEDLLSEVLKEQGKSEDVSKLAPRAPIVTVMGHVDHGKTSLLDFIRQTQVAAREAGGITQHIGAYSVKTQNGRSITFIDTPGHHSFTAMRARGAKVTDVVVLVVAADDGVMPQTKEAINHAKSANVPILVAINKMDKPGADTEKIKKALTEFNMVPEEWGGDTLYVPVSAKTGMGIPQLLETLALQTDVLELRANPEAQAQGAVVEAQLDKRRGPVMTILVQQGTLHEGDVIVAGPQWGRVRAMTDDLGKRLRDAGPSSAVEIMGLSGICTAGDSFVVVSDEKKAKQIAEMRQKMVRESELTKTIKVSLEDLYEKIQQGDVKELKVVVKADTSGSVEVLAETIQKLSTPKVAVVVIHGAVGGITESDIMLASASLAVIVGFNVRPDPSARALAERQGVNIRLYDVIYHLTEDLEKAMAGLLAPQRVEQFLGRAEVRQVFVISKVGAIAGCAVSDGKILRSATVRLIRDSVPVYTGKLTSLKHFKDDAREVVAGQECGIGIENFNDVKVGDVIEAFTISEVAPSIA